MANYHSNSQQRILKVMFCLSKNHYPGLKNGEIAKAAGITGSEAVRDLANLKEAGIAQQADNGCWTLTQKITHIAFDLLNEINKLEGKINELKQHATRRV